MKTPFFPQTAGCWAAFFLAIAATGWSAARAAAPVDPVPSCSTPPQLDGVDRPNADSPASPAWLARLFPHVANPDRLAHRFRRVEASDWDANGTVAGVVTVEVTYPGLTGNDESGLARIFLPAELGKHPERTAPLVFHAGYEIDDPRAAALVAKGYVVCTPRAHPLNPLGRGINLDVALFHAARQLLFVDPRRVMIQGGSAGGWMTLMLAADAFPLVCTMPEAPPLHWGYNAAYFSEHQAMAAAPAGSSTPVMPLMRIVGAIADQSRALYGVPFDAETYLAVSPLAHLDTLTVPTLMVTSTADTLVPIEQVDQSLVVPFDPRTFPAGFSTALTERFPGVNGHRSLLPLLTESRYALFRLPVGESPTRFGPNVVPEGPAKTVTLPFSKEKLWSIVVMEEGAVAPTSGHFKYFWSFDYEPFREWTMTRGVQPDQLTALKLQRLMKRLAGQSWLPVRILPAGSTREQLANVLDYPEAERADVLSGLLAFASDDACAAQLAREYERLPAELKRLGPTLGDGAPAEVRLALRTLLRAN